MIFKVTLGEARRRLAIPAMHTWDDLANAILLAFSFDCDHLNAFAVPDPYGADTWLVHPMMKEYSPASVCQLGESGLVVGQRAPFLYDFGDPWQLEVHLENVEPDRELGEPEMREQGGEAPEQYPAWEDADWDWDDEDEPLAPW